MSLGCLLTPAPRAVAPLGTWESLCAPARRLPAVSGRWAEPASTPSVGAEPGSHLRSHLSRGQNRSAPEEGPGGDFQGWELCRHLGESRTWRLKTTIGKASHSPGLGLHPQSGPGGPGNGTLMWGCQLCRGQTGGIRRQSLPPCKTGLITGKTHSPPAPWTPPLSGSCPPCFRFSSILLRPLQLHPTPPHPLPDIWWQLFRSTNFYGIHYNNKATEVQRGCLRPPQESWV